MILGVNYSKYKNDKPFKSLTKDEVYELADYQFNSYEEFLERWNKKEIKGGIYLRDIK